jgi:hypothetical protein
MTATATKAPAKRRTKATTTAQNPDALQAAAPSATTSSEAAAIGAVTDNSTSSAAALAAALTASISATAGIQLPDLDAPAVSPLQPAVSYKLAFADTSRFYRSTDGGHTSEPTASPAIAGAIVDLALQISPAHNRDGDDYRLRLAFIEPGGRLSELNINAVSIAPDGSAYITSPARSLTGALLAIADADEDMHASCSGARFSIRKGQGRGVFLETDIAVSGRWLAMSGALATLRVAKEPHRFCQQLTAIKQCFRSCGLLFAGPAVIHSGAPEADNATPVTAAAAAR